MRLKERELGLGLEAANGSLGNELPPKDKSFPPPRALEHTRANQGRRHHILFVIDQLCQLGGAERVLLNTIRLLPENRYRTSLLTFKLDSSLVGVIPCPHYVLPLRKTYDLNAVRMALRLRSLLVGDHIDIVHTFFETSDLWAGPIAKLSAGVKLVSSRRDMGILRAPKHFFAYRLLGPIFDRIIAVSEEVRGYCLSKDRLDPRRVVTIYNGLELEKVNACSPTPYVRASLGLGEGVPIITTVGNIRRIKGIDVLVETASRVVREIPQATFLVIGRSCEADYRQELVEQIAARGIEKNIRFMGESSDVMAFLKASDIFLLPSRSEGFSNALIEAMGCGLPCIATKVGGNAEAIEDGKNGYLIASGDAQAAANCIVTLSADQALRSRMSAAARATVEARFTAQVMIQKLVECYDQLLFERGK